MTSSFTNTNNGFARAVIVAGLLLVGGISARQAPAADTPKVQPQYTWSAEIVSFDKRSRMLTLKSRIENAAEIKGLDRFKKADPVMLTWTGRTWGAGVRDITRGHESTAPAETLILPAEFVSTEMDGRYVVYRMPIPEASVAKIEVLKPGEWVTAMSPRHSMDPSKAIVAIHAYNDVS